MFGRLYLGTSILTSPLTRAWLEPGQVSVGEGVRARVWVRVRVWIKVGVWVRVGK